MMKKLILFSFNLILLICSEGYCADELYVKDVTNPVINLNGVWEICLTPLEESHYFNQSTLNWKNIQVPGECMMQGFIIQHDKPFLYRKEFSVPADFKGKTIKIRFEGVYSYARIWVNGKYIRDHSGGFTAWEADITNVVTPGKTSVVTVEVTDRKDEISYASGYAKHPIGGILRNVSLLAVPVNYPERIFINTDFDQNFQNASLIVKGSITKTGSNNRILLELFDENNHRISLPQSSISLSDKIFQVSNLILNPAQWDAEHPNLYRLKVSFIENGTTIWFNHFLFGFREFEVKGNRFLVNGKQIRLKGACRHDIHPLLGRVSTPEYDLEDVRLAKESNMNFIRTSHYPPTENFLQLCDKYGLYVEDETAVCFVNTYRSPEYAPGSTENSTDYTERYLSQLEEMVENHRNHPSVIIWSIGNENKFGINFQKSYDWIKKADPSRPVIFSFPGTNKENNKSFDILSMHYPNIDGSLEQYGIRVKSFGNTDVPVLFDEWAHVPCYNNSTIKEDTNVRDFWGRSLDSMWMRTYDSDGGLGGAIWGMIDETFMLPDTTVGYGEWGIIDTWRRKKPEFWNVKKAYSPVRITERESDLSETAKVINIPVYNRFDFTNLNELEIRYKTKGDYKILTAPDIPPHTKGMIQLPAINSTLTIEFTDKKGNLVDSYLFKKREEYNQSTPQKISAKIDVSQNENQYIVRCENNLNYIIDKNTGLFNSIETSGKKQTFSGPWLNFRTKGKGNQTSSTQFRDYNEAWKLKSLSVTENENTVELRISGEYTSLPDVNFLVKILSDGSLTMNYSLTDLPKEYLREMGIKFVLEDRFDSLSWKRLGYWNLYPADHLSALQGRIPLYTNKQNIYKKAPVNAWQYDTGSYYYDGIDHGETDQLNYSSKATKENILEYSLLNKESGSVTVTGIGTEACRISKKDKKIDLFIDNLWDYPDLAWGNYQKNILPGKEFAGQIQLTIYPK